MGNCTIAETLDYLIFLRHGLNSLFLASAGIRGSHISKGFICLLKVFDTNRGISSYSDSSRYSGAIRAGNLVVVPQRSVRLDHELAEPLDISPGKTLRDPSKSSVIEWPAGAIRALPGVFDKH